MAVVFHAYVEDVKPLPVNRNDQRTDLSEEYSVASLRLPTARTMGTEPQLPVSSIVSEEMARTKPTKDLLTAETLADITSSERPAPTTPTRKTLYQACRCQVDASTPQKRARQGHECEHLYHECENP